MALPVTPNLVVPNPWVVCFFDLYLPGGVLRVSSGDEYAPAALGGYLYHARLLEVPALPTRLPRDLEALDEPVTISLQLGNIDGVLDPFFSSDIRGALAVGHLWEKTTGLVKQNYVTGAIVGGAQSDDYSAITLAVTTDPIEVDTMTFPRWIVTTPNFPQAPAAPPPSGGLGSVIPYPLGLALRVPCVYVRAPQEGDPEGGWDYLVGIDNVGVSRLYSGTATMPLLRGRDFRLLTTRYPIAGLAGRYYTAIRLLNGPARDGARLLPLTADVEACYPPVSLTADLAQWKFHGSFADDIGTYDFAVGRTAFGPSDLTTGDFVAGVTGLHVGAVRFSGQATPYLESPPMAITQNFSLSFWIMPPASGQATTEWGIVHGPGAAHGTGLDAGGWAISVDGAVDQLIVWARHVGDVTLMPKLLVNAIWVQGSGAWSFWHLERSGSTWTLYRDGSSTPIATATDARQIHYPSGTNPMIAGAFTRTTGAVGYFRGTLGPIHYATTPRTQDWALDWYWRMRRNPARFARVVLTDMGRVIDNTSFAALETAFNALGLKADLCLTTLVPARAVLGHFGVFRRMRFWRGVTLATHVAAMTTAPTAAIATFGVGDAIYANAALLERSRRSLAEAILTLTVQYRPQRNEAGAFQAFIGGPLPPRAVLDRGRQLVTRELSFVYDAYTADDVADFEAKMARLDDEIVRLRTDFAGWPVEPGAVVRAILPALSQTGVQLSAAIGFKPSAPGMIGFKPSAPGQVGFGPPSSVQTLGTAGSEYLAVGREQRGVESVLDLIPYGPALFIRQPGVLPVEPLQDTSAALDLGTTQTLATVDVDPTLRRLVFEFQLQVLTTLTLGTQLSAIGSFTVVGAATALDALNPTLPDQLTSYLETAQPIATSPLFAGRFAVPWMPVGIIRTVTLVAQATQTGSGGDVVLSIGLPGIVSGQQTFVLSATAGQINTLLIGPLMRPDPNNTSRGWAAVDLAQLTGTVLWYSTGAPAVRVMALYATVVQDVTDPGDFRFLRIWRLGPSDTAPAAPIETQEALIETISLTGIEDIAPGPGRYWYWVGVYDSLGRLVTPTRGIYASGGAAFANGLIGPVSSPTWT